MSVYIQLDKPHAYFTNLDFITGKVFLHIVREEPLAGIVVKLEAESRTRLAAPPQGNQGRRDRNMTELEVHKLLYKVATVFPPSDLIHAAPSAVYTLPAGRHEFAFNFKIPFNNACTTINSMRTNLTTTGLRLDLLKDSNQHVKKPLPPTLSGFPGEAEIVYYVKATVQRPAFYKENYRAIADFKFLPIEPIRPTPGREEAFARREFQFSPYVDGPQKSPFLRRSSSSYPGLPPKIGIYSRLPYPAIITRNEPLPLRIIIKRLNENQDALYLKLLQVELIGYTNIRAHDLMRKESSSWVIVSLANLNVALGDPAVPTQKDLEVDGKLWNHIPLPNTVPPSFQTCNLTRNYEIEVRIGLSPASVRGIKPELTVQALRMPVEVYSGVTPPPALIAEISKKGGHPNIPGGIYLQSGPASPAASQFQPQSPTPATFPPSNAAANAYQAPPGDSLDEAPPPSYEDAMADDFAPVDGPRREYQQPSARPVVADEKGGLRDRLFP